MPQATCFGRGVQGTPRRFGAYFGGGNRDANRALHLICVVRMRIDERTRRYVARRTAEGKSSREIMRCLKRYIAREVYRVLVPATSPTPIGVSTA